MPCRRPTQAHGKENSELSNTVFLKSHLARMRWSFFGADNLHISSVLKVRAFEAACLPVMEQWSMRRFVGAWDAALELFKACRRLVDPRGTGCGLGLASLGLESLLTWPRSSRVFRKHDSVLVTSPVLGKYHCLLRRAVTWASPKMNQFQGPHLLVPKPVAALK